MPSYFFHLALELYPYQQDYTCTSEERRETLYLPPPGTDIFKTFSPLNKRRRKGKSESGLSTPSRSRTLDGNASGLRDLDTQDKAIPVRDIFREVSGESKTPSQVESAHGRRSDTEPTDIHTFQTVFKLQDWRCDSISVESIDMIPVKGQGEDKSRGKSTSSVVNGIGAGSGGLATKGRYLPSEPDNTDVGWGVVHLYRDAAETPGLYEDEASNRSLKVAGVPFGKSKDAETTPFKEEDCTTLCILAVPSYLAPSDFLGFVGEKTRDEVSHFRMIRSAKANRYMVLMKFKSARRAREWRKEWNGKVFNSMEVGPVFPRFLS